MTKPEHHKCACSFAKAVGDKNPFNFPRIGIATNVLYRSAFMIRHKLTGHEAIISRHAGKCLEAEADACCFDWFEENDNEQAR